MNTRNSLVLREMFSDPAWTRLLSELRAKWQRYNRAAGKIRIETNAEALALGGLLGRPVFPGENVSLSQIETALRESTRFQCDLRTALEVYFGEPIRSNAERKAAAEADWQNFVERLECEIDAAALPDTDVKTLKRWLRVDDSYLRTRYARRGEILLHDFRCVLRIHEVRPREGSIALAILANEAVGDPHALDPDTPVAILFERTLAAFYPEFSVALLQNAEGRDLFWAEAGIVRDRISPKVDTFGLRGDHFDLCFLEQFPLQTFSLRAVESLRGKGLQASGNVVFVVENASVFDQLVESFIDAPATGRPTIVCTNGWLNLADRLLLQEIVESGSLIRYSGDFDESGLAIASFVLSRFPEASLWRFSAEDYRDAVRPSNRKFDIDKIRSVRLNTSELVKAMREYGQVAYQEALVPKLLDDLRQHVARSA